MQDYSYSVLALIAISIHLIVNFDLFFGRGEVTYTGKWCRGFLASVLVFYITDAAWGILAGLRWFGVLYVETVAYFLALAVVVFMWCRYVTSYLSLGGWTARIVTVLGHSFLACTVALLVANVFNRCMFYFDEEGNYTVGVGRPLFFAFLFLLNILMSCLLLDKVFHSQDAVRRRNMMVLVFCVAMTAAIALQVAWPLLPFTSLGCLVGCCFLHIFVIEEERMEFRKAVFERKQTARHMAELERALDRARTAEKSRNMFFSIVSHDIRTPLNAILGYSELLRNGISNHAEREEALDSIRASGTTLLQLVNDVLDLAKIDAGKMTLIPVPVSLGRLTDDVFASFRLAAAEKGIALVNKASGVPTVLLDDHRVRQIFFNLVGNAVKFTDSGSVTVSASYVGERLEFVVSDTGCGIPASMLSRILDPFVQVDDPSHSAERSMGSGLGLSICRNLVEVMGGELTVDSEYGKGSSFTVCIPGVKTACEPAREGAEAVDAGPKPQKIPGSALVVDDSRVNRTVLNAFLKKAGVSHIGFAGDGLEALVELDSAVASGRPYDIVFTDFWMPTMNGLEFIEKLRGDKRFEDLAVYAVTADTEICNEVRANLFDGILLKPLTYEKLLEALE